MRYLNKIIFTNSAHIPYAEIRVDGNVHFVGTQGVGKSTLLRALLFFYNADKQHLGIKQEQDSFDKFYFEYANSYILYEVQREIGAYTILTTRHQGRAVFRFIDAPYKREWIVNDDGEVLSDWVRIRQNIAKMSQVEPSERIDSYEKYRDIIFGNLHERGNKYAKYALVESSKYQNIPRSIQNVFLNSKLDAEFVKKTIIESMTENDTEESIKLSVYRSLVADFEREYDDISLWYTTEKNGEILVRRQAEQVIRAYHETIAYEQQIRRSIRELNYAVEQAQEQLPIVQDERKHTEEQIQKEQQKRREIENDFRTEERRLNQSIGEKNGKLKEIREKRKEYAAMDIEAMLRLQESEPRLQIERKQQQDILDTLTKQYADIEAKYKSLIDQLDVNFERFNNAQVTELNHLRDEVRKKREKDNAEKQLQLDAAEKRYNAIRDEIEERYLALQEDKNKQSQKIQETHQWQPYLQEKESIRTEFQQLDVEEKEASATKVAKEQEIERLRVEAQREVQQAESDYQLNDAGVRQKLQSLQKEKCEVDTLLEHYKGSLYEWLTKNKLQWEDNIGKVLDEQRVLYAQGLSPEIDERSNDSIYGVKLDVSQLESTHRSPNEYRQQSKDLQEQIDALRNELNELLQTKEQAIKKIGERLSDKLKPLNQEIISLRVRLENIPQQRRNKQTRLETLERKEKEDREQKINLQQEELDKMILRLTETKGEKESKRSLYEKEKKQIKDSFESKGKVLKKQIDDFKAQQAAELTAEQTKYKSQKRQYQNQREAELKGKGADVTVIQKQEELIHSIDQQLQKIEEQRKTVFAYNKDKEELFDKEDTIKQEKKVLEEKVNNLQHQYDEKIRKIGQKLTELNEKKVGQDKKIQTWQEGLEQYRQIIEIEHLLTDEYLQEEKRTQNTKTCQTIIFELRGALNDKKRKQDELKRNVNTFNSHFTTNNTFKFKTMPSTDEEYVEIAISLQEFMDNNKIEEYRKRTSEHYNNILQGVSREVGNLMTHQSEIESVIREINRDFREKNFAGVIKSIELRIEPSDDSMMRLLQKIKEFSDENALNMGETNLFSDNNKDEVNHKVVDYLIRFMKQLQKEPNKQQLMLSDTFNLQFRIKENDQDKGWVERINNVGSDGTDILVKAMINIMLINVFKNKAMRNKNQEFIIHCMMDEIGKLHSNNVRGILHFANQRNIYLINSSPESLNPYDYKYTYMLKKDNKSMTQIIPLLKNELGE